MTLSNPLIKDLKGLTRKLMEFEGEINDDNKNLALFCKNLERCFEKGVAMRFNTFGIPKESKTWFWMNDLASKNERSLYVFSSIVESVRDNSRVNTSTGHLRLFIRTCLTRKCLHEPILFLINEPQFAVEYYDKDSIVGNEILGQIFVSVLLQISKLNFKLDLKNASFLDETWELPDCKSLELVPCKTLGISVCFARGRALITRVEENSVADEDDKVQIGDVLDEINGTIVTANSKGKLQGIMKKATGKPISLRIIKHRDKHSEEIYGPIVSVIRSSGSEHMKELLKAPEPQNTELPETRNVKRSSIAGFPVKYCGSVSTGSLGDIKQVEKAIWALLRSTKITKVPVLLDCLEMRVKVTRESDESVLIQNNYMEISSCGRTNNIANYFAFISGETMCNVAKEFKAHIFYHEDLDEVQLILQSIGQGFRRTHFVV